MPLDTAEKKQNNWWKLGFGLVYLTAAILLARLFWDGLWLDKTPQPSDSLPRFPGCIAFALSGFAFLAINSIPSKSEDFPYKYVYYYPVLVLLGATLVFGFCQMFESSNGYLFKFIAYPLSFAAGYLVDSYWKMATKFSGA